MALAPLITAEQLRLSLTTPTYMALFDEEQTGSVPTVDASATVALVRRRAHIRCVSWLGLNYKRIPLVTDTEVPDLLVDAELNYAVGISLDMHPEYVRAYGEEPRRKGAFDQAELCMQRVQEAVLQFVDAPSAGEPENVGGVVVDSGQRVFLGSTNGALNSGDY